MKITRRQLKMLIREKANSTAKYDKDPALKGDQDELPDQLQKAIIDKADEEDVSESRTVKITREHIRKIIKKGLLKEQAGTTVELMQNPDSDAVSAAWPEGVYHNGGKVIDVMYNNAATKRQMDYLAGEGFEDAQENYLGYDPQSGDFVMGFDAFEQAYDGYGNADNDGMMQGVLMLVSPEGRPMEIITVVPDIFYPTGLRAAHTAFPQLIDVRLD